MAKLQQSFISHVYIPRSKSLLYIRTKNNIYWTLEVQYISAFLRRFYFCAHFSIGPFVELTAQCDVVLSMTA